MRLLTQRKRRGVKRHKSGTEANMKKIGFLGIAIVLLLIGVFVWALSGASDSKAPTDEKVIDVSPQL